MTMKTPMLLAALTLALTLTSAASADDSSFGDIDIEATIGGKTIAVATGFRSVAMNVNGALVDVQRAGDVEIEAHVGGDMIAVATGAYTSALNINGAIVNSSFQQ